MILGFEELIRNFIQAGGWVLVVILMTTLVLWTLIVERLLFFRKPVRRIIGEAVDLWNQQKSHSSWRAHKIREAKISQAKEIFFHSISTIKTLVLLCPLLGLLGTVTGMIAVFDSLAIVGTGNARMMASGISMATIPTMAGMVASISGLYFGSRLEERAQQEVDRLSDEMKF